MSSLQIDRRDGIVTLTLDRPARKNAIDLALCGELTDALREIGTRADDRCVVVTGTEGDFSSGADLAGVTEGEHGLARMRRFNAMVQAAFDLPQPTIARIEGVAVGIGVNLALACDLAVAADSARLSQIFVKRGLSLDGGGSWLLPRRVGMARAKELALFGDMVPAPEAAAMGLINRSVPADELDGVVAEWARRLAAGPPIAMAMTKRMLNRASEVSFEQALDEEARSQTVNFSTADTMEAMQAFMEKREPNFRGL